MAIMPGVYSDMSKHNKTQPGANFLGWTVTGELWVSFVSYVEKSDHDISGAPCTWWRWGYIQGLLAQYWSLATAGWLSLQVRPQGPLEYIGVYSWHCATAGPARIYIGVYSWHWCKRFSHYWPSVGPRSFICSSVVGVIHRSTVDYLTRNFQHYWITSSCHHHQCPPKLRLSTFQGYPAKRALSAKHKHGG